MRLATWNVNSLNVRMARVEEWLTYAKPDVLCLQETKLADEKVPTLALSALGYEVAHSGAGQWNGVAILSRIGLEDVATEMAGDVGGQRSRGRFISARCGGLEVASVYVPNGRSVGSEHYLGKLEWLSVLEHHLESESPKSVPLAVCGDFNVAPDDRDVWDPSAFVGATHVSDAEREALQRLLKLGMVDAFRLCHQESGLYSWWDYRAGSFHKHLGMRIDLILISEGLAAGVRFAVVDRNARKGRQPSDHAPVLVDFDL